MNVPEGGWHRAAMTEGVSFVCLAFIFSTFCVKGYFLSK